MAPLLLACTFCWGAPAASAAAPSPLSAHTTLDAAAATRFAGLALKCLHQEYPNHISHTLASDADVRAPRALTPAFYGCYDWHSDVHGHWLLVRLVRLFPDAPFAAAARAALERTFTAANIATEVAYLKAEGRAPFERPYGLAWLLQLAAELRAWDDPDARRWRATLAPLETEAATRLANWLPKLHYPIRIGEHDQTAFSFGLVWDWAGIAQDARMRALLHDAAQRFYLKDRNCPLAYEPSGEDFLSPCIAEADFMRRVLPPPAFAAWLSEFLPQIPHQGRQFLADARGRDRSLRSQAGPYRWPQSQSRLDAPRHRAGTPGHRCTPTRAPERIPTTCRGGAAIRDRGALRGRSLARHVRGLPDERRRTLLHALKGSPGGLNGNWASMRQKRRDLSHHFVRLNTVRLRPRFALL